jgi:hypothetical protein
LHPVWEYVKELRAVELTAYRQTTIFRRLAHAKRFAELHGGRYGLKANTGKAVALCLEFPLEIRENR